MDSSVGTCEEDSYRELAKDYAGIGTERNTNARTTTSQATSYT